MMVAASGTMLAAAQASEPKIAIFDHQTAGGQGASVDGLLQGLRSQGYDAHRITDLDPLTLCLFDIVYLSEMHHPIFDRSSTGRICS